MKVRIPRKMKKAGKGTTVYTFADEPPRRAYHIPCKRNTKYKRKFENGLRRQLIQQQQEMNELLKRAFNEFYENL